MHNFIANADECMFSQSHTCISSYVANIICGSMIIINLLPESNLGGGTFQSHTEFVVH